jgi:hypothetical protein
MPKGQIKKPITALMEVASRLADDFESQRQALTALHHKIGEILTGKATPLSNGNGASHKAPKVVASKPTGKKRGRRSAANLDEAKQKIQAALKGKKTGVSRGELAHALGYKPELVSQLLKGLATEKLATSKGERRNARWFSA